MWLVSLRSIAILSLVNARRPISARNTHWAAAIARALARARVRPNVISVASAVFAAGAGGCLWGISRCQVWFIPWLFIVTAAMIQLRLLCNLFDGMVAIEGGFKTKSGEVFNELPDRFADVFVFLGAGYSAGQSDNMVQLGWAAALLCLLTAYVRALGASAGATQQFCGPMAKQHRMAVMTIACVVSAILCWFNHAPLIKWAVWIVIIGTLITVFRRTLKIIRELESR